MEQLRAYVLAHREITGGCFSWYDTFAYYGYVGDKEVQLNIRLYSDDISLNTDDRAAIIDWTYRYDGFDHFFTDPEKVKQKYTSPDGHRLIVTYYRDEDWNCDTFPDGERYISADPDADPADDCEPFASYEEFKAAVIADLEKEGEKYEIEPGY